MKVSKYLFATLTVSVILAGCSDTDEVEDDINETSGEASETSGPDEEVVPTQTVQEKLSNMEETDDETLDAVIGQSHDIESYQALLNLEGQIDDARPEALDADVRFREGEEDGPPSLHLKSGGEDRTFSKDGETFYYNGTDWVNISDSAGALSLYQVTYNNAVLSLADIRDQLEKEEDGNTVVYSYDGENEKVFETFKQLFTENFSNITLSEIDNSLEIEVDSAENTIKEIDYEAEGETETGPFELTGDVEFKSFNSIDNIEIPEKVRN
ncbi:MAG TPA: hypothetical protein H9891_10125 [Candidatus Salinicoccus stercoripullorum]|uniref:Lipoprotein n=1 Tax=Candidatus Salinicoccus stercoripullorum TaxID=2838756 RepID=A0A9D1QJA8_9STAP|nr:hypothetical protein [Candidatus Salinicoccus stercoripullorum]